MNERRNGYKHESEHHLRPPESLFINTSVGLHVFQSDNGPKLSIIDNQSLEEQVYSVNGASEGIVVLGYRITPSLEENGEAKIRIESEAEIKSVKATYKFPFKEKFEYQRNQT